MKSYFDSKNTHNWWVMRLVIRHEIKILILQNPIFSSTLPQTLIWRITFQPEYVRICRSILNLINWPIYDRIFLSVNIIWNIVSIYSENDIVTPGWQMALWTPFFPFWAKMKIVITVSIMISVTTFSLEIETISSSFTKIIYIFDIFSHFFTFEPRICKVWKGKNLCSLGVQSF